MEYQKSYLNYTVYDYTSLFQVMEILLLSSLCYFLPMVMTHPQWVLGTIVNAILFRLALSSKFVRTLPAILLPSLGVFTAGLLFGSLTKYVIYFIPFIWIANSIYVLAIKYISHKYEQNYTSNVIVPSLLKSAFLFAAALLMVYVFSFPAAFLTAMGLMQLFTALGGGYLASIITKLEMVIRKA